jgi:hypothetical protein
MPKLMVLGFVERTAFNADMEKPVSFPRSASEETINQYRGRNDRDLTPGTEIQRQSIPEIVSDSLQRTGEIMTRLGS